jgi:hypothetical protein
MVMICLFLLSITRLCITISPYAFHNANHLILSIISFLFIFGVPLLLDIVRFVQTQQGCDSYAVFVVESLYGTEMADKAPVDPQILRPILNLSTLAINIGIAVYNGCSTNNVVVPLHNNNTVQVC